MPAPRIDTLRRQLAAAQAMLGKAAATLDTLHHLAYDRPTANAMRVAGGQPDYALDNHGDPVARHAYAELAVLVDHLCQQVATKVHPALELMTEAQVDGKRHPYAISAMEHAELLEAQARRIRRGEFDPGRTEAQPQIPGAEKKMARKIRALEQELTRERRARQTAEAKLSRLMERQP